MKTMFFSCFANVYFKYGFFFFYFWTTTKKINECVYECVCKIVNSLTVQIYFLFLFLCICQCWEIISNSQHITNHLGFPIFNSELPNAMRWVDCHWKIGLFQNKNTWELSCHQRSPESLTELILKKLYECSSRKKHLLMHIKRPEMYW